MTENLVLEDQIMPTDSDNVDSNVPLNIHSSTTKESVDNTYSAAIESSDDETTLTLRKKKLVQRFSDSDSDIPKDDETVLALEENDNEDLNTFKRRPNKTRIRKIAASDDDTDNESKYSSVSMKFQESIDDEESDIIVKNKLGKSRLQKVASDDEDSNSDSHKETRAPSIKEQQLRIKNKNKKLKEKFKNLLSKRDKNTEIKKKDSEDEFIKEGSVNEDSDSSDDEVSSIDKIKQMIKERSDSLKMTICDPDTSDEDCNHSKTVYKSKPKKDHKRTKLTSPKPQRMSAKQAMENMQKIKSESNRMLRERDVSLPYHRPKALSLQDIMKRRRPAVSSDGKALPIKMNEDQLKQYVLLLEQRQKEMMELCKSESEEEEVSEEKDIEKAPIVNSIDVNSEISSETTENIADITEIRNKTTAQIASDIDDIKNKDDEEVNTESIVTNGENYNKEVFSAAEISPNSDSPLVKDFQDKSADMSAEMELVYNDSVEESNADEISKNDDLNKIPPKSPVTTIINDIAKDGTIENIPLVHNDKQFNIHNTEAESQLISLHYDSEHTENFKIHSESEKANEDKTVNKSCEDTKTNSAEENELDDFPDDDMDMDQINMDDIDSIIENAEIIKNTDHSGFVNSPALVRDIPVLNVKPKLTGAPGMVIDLDGSDPIASKKLTGVELLKERFTFFSKLKTPEEMERDREKRQKPGAQHLKLKQELEDIIAEQRSLEWSKRLENEKQEQSELNAIRGDESDPDDDIDKIEAKLNENDVERESSSESEEEEDLLEDDIVMEDKPKKKNPLVADEAEESDVDETGEKNNDNRDVSDDDENGVLNGDGAKIDETDGDKSEEESSEEDESSESEDEKDTKPKKGRILKAFEDSDDEDVFKAEDQEKISTVQHDDSDVNKSDNIIAEKLLSQSQSDGVMDSQDDVIQLAQIAKQVSSDVFTSQESDRHNILGNSKLTDNSKDDEDLGTQTFSILDTTKTVKLVDDPDKLTSITDDANKLAVVSDDLDQLTVISDTQPYSDNLDAVVGMCSGSFQTQNCIEVPPIIQSQMSQSQAIGEDLLDMCTGKFYDNQFVSSNDVNVNTSDDLSQDMTPVISNPVEENKETVKVTAPKINEILVKEKQKQEDLLKSVLDELNEPDFEAAKPLKFFFDGKSQNKENELNVTNTQAKKRFVIDSDEETNDNSEMTEKKKKKKFKKKKLEQRALQISDDEDEYDDQMEEDNLSENEDDNDNQEERLIEYDSEENEVEVKPQSVKKKKRKTTEFFEQEAELTSEDEWVGSGDEDEAGLDRMEREEGDDEVFNQKQLQRELGQIHMRDVLDQDKREVRLIQELLFEDGDLGGGGRQRKFRWRNADGEEVTGTIPDEFADTQEEEFESEEQWRKQRHEREMFLRQMKNGDEKEDELNVSVNRTSIIKANLCSRTMSSLLEEANQNKVEVPKAAAVPEKKTTKDIPSPAKKPFAMFQQNYHGSLLTRGQGALARLAALATPLAADDDAPKIGLLAPSSKRNFVFAAVSKEDVEPKVTKRKAESKAGTPRLVKKIKTEEKQNRPKSSLLEFLKA